MIQIKCLDKFKPLVTKKKRVKMIVGGRASTKTTFIADYVLVRVSMGNIWCCGREYQNSIDESVYRTLCDEIERLGLEGFTISATGITHQSGGAIFFRGLARNITSIKGMLSGVEGLWIEEGENCSDNTLRVLTASLRNSAKDVEDMIKLGIDVENMPQPEIWVSMNRASINDPIAKKWLSRAEPSLERCQYYEDDTLIIVEANYNDLPRAWFLGSGLEQERQDDYKNMPRSMYDSKWLGKYLETIDNAIIMPEWFDACIDAHIKLGFEPLGQEIIAYDPADTGDAKAIAYAHGSVVLDVRSNTSGLIDTATDWACSHANAIKPDVFTWDADGIGGGLKRQISEALSGKKILVVPFKGSSGVDNPDQIYDEVETDSRDSKTNREMFANSRAQNYWRLKDRIYRTYLAVEKGKYSSPDDLISFNSEIKELAALKAEVCRIPRRYVASGRYQILSKPDMKKLGIQSPNMADAVMMLQRVVSVHDNDHDNYEDYETQTSGGDWA